MATILVVEGNTPAINARAAAEGRLPAAENYAAVMQTLAPGLAARIARPSWPGFDAEALDLGGIDGVVFTGSGVMWSADAPEAAPHRRLMERAFAAGLPVLGSCYGLHLGAAVLGGALRWSPNGPELPIARGVEATAEGRGHPIHAGRAPRFDCVCIHRDEVARVPASAVVTASNAHTEVQGMVCEQGGVRFWGVQYHPEMTLGSVARMMARAEGETPNVPEALRADPAARARIAELVAIGEGRETAPEALARHGVRPEVLDFDARTVELRNWLAAALGIAAGAGGEVAAAG